MSKRTSIKDYHMIEKPEDLDRVVKDKRAEKRATKEKGRRRNRHYEKTLLKYLSSNTNG